jgi:hypothetical protein
VLPLSTAFFQPPVQTVGKTGLNSTLSATLPAFHFVGAWFSKTGRRLILAVRLVSASLSTFPSSTATTTKREWIIFAFRRSRNFLVLPLLLPTYFGPGNPQAEAQLRFSRAFAVV